MEDSYRQKGVGIRRLHKQKKKAVWLLQSSFPLGDGKGMWVYQADYLTSAEQVIPDWLV